jgi:alkylation response protein AidB-like acyl-CoA dehydrogenase
MDFFFDEDSRLFHDAAKKLLERHCTPDLVRQAWSSTNGSIPGIWSKMAAQGLMALGIPESLDGLGRNEIDWALILEEAGRCLICEPLCETALVGAGLLSDAFDDDVCRQWLPQVCSGDTKIAFCLPEVPLAYAADRADLLLLANEEAIHLRTVDSVELTRQRPVDHSQHVFDISWTPRAEDILVSGPRARDAIKRAFDRYAFANAAMLMGVADRMHGMAVEYAKVREQFGRPIGTFQAVQHMLAEAWVEIEFARPLVFRAAHSIATEHTDRSLHVSMAKAAVGRAAYHTSRVALQVHGAIGYTVEYDLHLWMKRAWWLAGRCGDSRWHTSRVAQILAQDPPLATEV